MFYKTRQFRSFKFIACVKEGIATTVFHQQHDADCNDA